MRVADSWKDYELIDCTAGERLERWGDVILIRPDPQVIWETKKRSSLWENAHARYVRSASGGGGWEYYKKVPDAWKLSYRDLVFQIKPMGFKHTGIFPEQAVNWDMLRGLIETAGRPVKVLNLFAYTGAATVSALKAGAEVVHVDAAKGMVLWAKENAALSGVAGKSVRWIVDDCQKFVARESRRGNTYAIILMDPPSYGRGPSGEIWKLEDELFGLVGQCARVLSEKPLAFVISSYTAGLSPCVMSTILDSVIGEKFGGQSVADEIGLKAASGLTLPCGSTAVWRS